MYEVTGASYECRRIISKSFPEPIFTIIREGEGALRAQVCPVFKLNVNSFE